MKWWKPLGVLMSLSMGTVTAQASDLDNAPAAFERDGMNVPIDIQTVSVQYTFDLAQQKATGEAKVTFTMGKVDGFPLLDLLPKVESLSLNGRDLPPSALPEIAAPDGVTTFRVLKEEVAANSVNELAITFDLTSQVTFANGAAKVGFFMSDLADRSFFEQYGPANMEYDRIKFDFSVAVLGAQREHVLFANGEVTETGANAWTVKYPDYFGSSSLYFHLSAKDDFKVREFTYDGAAASFPVTIYSRDAATVAAAYDATVKVLGNLESKLGPFAHDKLVIYIAGSGGMEYCGATMTSLWALPHELTHSWFARGVMPLNGNSGWIDEAVASWQDNDFRTANSAPSREAVNLGNFSPYRRDTTEAAYTEGEELLAEFDFMFKDQGGLLPILRDLHDAKKRDHITVDFFHRFVESRTNRDLQAIFDRYVYGKTKNARGDDIVVPEKHVSAFEIVSAGHPYPYSADELVEHR